MDFVYRMAVCGAGDGAFPAGDALIGGIHYFGGEGLRFGVMTPSAVQGTALEKYGGTDAGAVVGTEPLNIQYSSA